ncbi:hypothetical protein SAMN05216204_101109 [Massilia yuzhufengensis]|uniref:Lipoprotein n=2 Tax=Massilia yuzhufengensis TaxID=1164594 RepID=A0A1I1DAN4_9BURK|nr:hypothetical protein SAMN05216204_101109 [Massilia yuzhufengensis]
MVLVLALAAGCSSVRFTYNQGDTLLYWWLDSYADLEGSQADIAKRDIDKLFRWHRQTQLRDYAALLGNMQRQLAGNPTQADLINTYKEIRVRGERLAAHAVPELTTLALSIKPDQIADIESKFNSKNADYRKKFLDGSLEKRQKARFKKSMDQFELWFGNFSSEQETTLRRASDARPLDNDAWLEERVWRQRRILALLRKFQQEKPNREQAAAQIQAMQRELFGRMESPERKAFYDSSVDQTTKYIMTAIRIATPAQKKHAQDRMQGWINDFQTLATGK